MKDKFALVFTIGVIIIAVVIGHTIFQSMQGEINDRYLLCNQWCCGNVDANGNLTGYCSDTLYDAQTDECVYVLSGERVNFSDNVCPYAIKQTLNANTEWENVTFVWHPKNMTD